MKKLYIFLLMVAGAGSMQAQYAPLLNENSYWRGQTYGWIVFDFFIHMDGDSVVDGVTYKKVFQSNALDGDQYLAGLLREDEAAQQVFVLSGDGEHQIYDFSAEAGDVVSSWGVGSEQSITITSVETVTVSGESRKKINFQDSWGPSYWIEGVGSIYSLMDGVLGPVADYNPIVTCYYESNQLGWSNPSNQDPCGAMLKVKEQAVRAMNIWPNPAGNNLNITIEGGGNNLFELEIISGTGQKVVSKKVSVNGIAEIDLSDLSPGLYLIGLKQDNELVSSSRLLKL